MIPFAKLKQFLRKSIMQLKNWLLGKRVYLTSEKNDWQAVKNNCDAFHEETVLRQKQEQTKKRRTRKNLKTHQE